MTQFKPIACGFHSHCDVGSLDGGSTVETKILRAAQLGRTADTLTDHGTMNALAQHWFAAEKLFKSGKTDKKIKSIHGIEAYLIDDIRGPQTLKNGKEVPRYVHLTIHFKTARAFEYFSKLTPIMEARGIVKVGELKPLLKYEELLDIASEITIGSSCLVGAVQKNFIDDTLNKDQKYDAALSMYQKLNDLVGKDNFYVEVFPHIITKDWVRPVFDKENKRQLTQQGYFKEILEKNHVCGDHCKDIKHVVDECGHNTIPIDIQRAGNQFVVETAKRFGNRIVISEDSHHASPEDYIVQSVRLGNGQDRWKFSENYCMRSTDEWAVNLKQSLGVSDRDIEEWVDNSYHFVEQFNNYTFSTAKDRILLPKTEMIYEGWTKSNKEKFWELAEKHNKLPPANDPLYSVYKDRIDTELAVLCDNGIEDFLPYFFILEDAAEYARKNNITYTCRGSAGGSLALFALGVSITDPIKYDLPFERFLTVGRIKSGSLPDIDSDWDDRTKILDYLRSKYGGNVALISTNLMLRFKSSILDCERSIIGQVRPDTAAMCKNITVPPGESDKEWLFGKTDKTTGARIEGFWDNQEDPLAAKVRKYAKDNPEIWDAVLRCIGITKSKGVHAGGVVITPAPVENYMPLIQTEKGLATAWDMKAVEAVGGVKYDFLGIDALEAMGLAFRSIKERTGVDIPWKEMDHDPSVYSDIIHKGHLHAIFQLNTDLVRPYLHRIRPMSILDLAVTTALIRPGALDAPSPDPADPYTGGRAGSDENIHAAEYFVRCREGRKKPYYIHPDLEPILGETFGVLVFQEQALKIFRDLAGYTYEEAEEVRRGIGKKIKEVLEKHLGILSDRIIAKGWTPEQAKRLCDTIIASAKYSFNKSHSVAYAQVAYNGCYLKKHYPMDFWRGYMEVASDDHSKLKKYLAGCGVPILPVDVEKSHQHSWSVEGTSLRPPLSLIQGVGEKASQNIKSFLTLSLDEFANRDIISCETEESDEVE